MKKLTKKSYKWLLAGLGVLSLSTVTTVSAVACYWAPNTTTNTINITTQPVDQSYTTNSASLPTFSITLNWTYSSFPAQTQLFYQWYWYSAANSSNPNNNAGGGGGGIMFKNGSGEINDLKSNQVTVSYQITANDLKLFDHQNVWIYCVAYTQQGPNQKPDVANNNGFITSNAVKLTIINN